MKAILVGYSGHGLVVAESAIIMGVEFYGYTDLYEIDKNPFDLRYFGNEQSKDYNWNLTDKYVLGIGSNKLRSKAFKFLKSKSKVCLKIINKSASVSEFSSVGEGTFIARNVSINPFSQIGNYCIVNTSSSIDHECIIENGVHLAPGSILCGNVKIGENSIIGAGSVVLSNIKNNSIVYGIPAK